MLNIWKNREEAGVAMVEFTAISLLFLTMVGVIFDFGYFFYRYSMMTSSAGLAAKELARSQDRGGGTCADAAMAAATTANTKLQNIYGRH